MSPNICVLGSCFYSDRNVFDRDRPCPRRLDSRTDHREEKMNTQAEGQDSLGGFARVIDSLRQTAQRAADAAVVAVRAQANGVVDAYRAELRRAVAVFALACAVLLFSWTAAMFGALALE